MPARTRSIIRLPPVRMYWTILASFAVLGILLFVLNAVAELPRQVHAIVGSTGEALLVAVVISLVVEPRLLRYFGEELSSQTFWASFYSRAPHAYREAIKELAAVDQFVIAMNCNISLDWANDDRTVIRVRNDMISHRENRASRPQPLIVYWYVYESPFPDYRAEFRFCSTICEATSFYIDLMDADFTEVVHVDDGHLRLVQKRDHPGPYYHIPPGERFAMMCGVTTYVAPIAYFPIAFAQPVLDFTIQFSGTALPDLTISIQRSVHTLMSGNGSELAAKGRIRVGGVFMEGQVVLLAWRATAAPAATWRGDETRNELLAEATGATDGPTSPGGESSEA